MNSSYSSNQYYSQFHDNQYHPPLILKQEDHHHHHHLHQAADDIRSTKNKKKKTPAAAAGGKGGVRLSTDPQSVAARERRHRISHRLKTLQSLVPGAAKLDTVSVLDHAIHYVHFLRSQIRFHHLLLLSSDSAVDLPPPPPPPPDCFGGELAVEVVGPSPPYHSGVWVEEACCFGSPVQGGAGGACSGGSTSITPYF